MVNHTRDREFWAIAKTILADPVALEVLSRHGHASYDGFSTILSGLIPAEITVLFLSPPPSGNVPPEVYLYWTLWSNEPGRHPHGHFCVTWRTDSGWKYSGDEKYRRVAARADALRQLPEYAKVRC